MDGDPSLGKRFWHTPELRGFITSDLGELLCKNTTKPQCFSCGFSLCCQLTPWSSDLVIWHPGKHSGPESFCPRVGVEKFLLQCPHYNSFVCGGVFLSCLHMETNSLLLLSALFLITHVVQVALGAKMYFALQEFCCANVVFHSYLCKQKQC